MKRIRMYSLKKKMAEVESVERELNFISYLISMMWWCRF
jgi:hypothetical protein